MRTLTRQAPICMLCVPCVRAKCVRACEVYSRVHVTRTYAATTNISTLPETKPNVLRTKYKLNPVDAASQPHISRAFATMRLSTRERARWSFSFSRAGRSLRWRNLPICQYHHYMTQRRVCCGARRFISSVSSAACLRRMCDYISRGVPALLPATSGAAKCNSRRYINRVDTHARTHSHAQRTHVQRTKTV